MVRRVSSRGVVVGERHVSGTDVTCGDAVNDGHRVMPKPKVMSGPTPARASRTLFAQYF
jgi:hypothetical protein